MPDPVLALNVAQNERLNELIDRALEEDVGAGDLTTSLLIPATVAVEAMIVAREPGVMAGGPFVLRILHRVDPSLVIRQKAPEGSWVLAGDTVIHIEGRAQAILTAERLCLNFLGRCSGIATFTRRFVEEVKRWDVKILDTRKTIPGLRLVERYAVRVGGGENHRQGLFDQVLVKDNHHQVLQRFPLGTLGQKIREFRRIHPGVLVEIEVETLEQLESVLTAQPDIVLLDNMDVDTVAKAVQMLGKRALSEVSGGVTLQNVAEYARTGVDRISIGALTHSAPHSDFSLEIHSERQPQ